MNARLVELEKLEALANEIEAKLATAKAGLKYCKTKVNVISGLCKAARKGQA